ncbi:hypothetical protein DCAR_0519766 [Daucus carota subsp. sativus]|uniref:Uncharacterized protein n=1 Tax=Daucus carota subsp. sativus TaxID=79200 RepID=A0A164Y677_DAUCS|nr:hypothetical protein DCAR_0519766 [Daucus carota subsp. sativus]
MTEEGKSYNDLMHELQQQFLLHREKTSQKLQKIEQLMKEAVQKLYLFRIMQTKVKKEKFVNPFGRMNSEKYRTSRVDVEIPKENLNHLKLSFPKFVEGSQAVEWLEDCETYFEIYKVVEHKKTTIAGMHLDGNAKSWLQVKIGK